MSRTIAALFGMGAFALAACAATPQPYQGPSHESRALSVTKAADLVGLRDAKLPEGASAPAQNSTLPSAALSGGLNALSPPTGFSSLGGGLMGVASVLFSGPAPAEAASYSRVIAFMPLSEADTAEASADKLNQLIQAKLAEALSTVDLGPSYKLEKTEKEMTSYRKGEGLFGDFDPQRVVYQRTTFAIKGGECDEPKVRCGYEILASSRPVRDFAPAFLGGYPAWVYTRTQGIPNIARSFIDNRNWREQWRAVFPDLEVYRRMSASLPDWVFLYLAPSQVSVWDDEQKELVLLPFPAMLNKGEMLFFVRNEH